MKSPLTPLRAWFADPKLTPALMKALIIGPIAAAVVVPLLLIAVPYIDFFNDMALQYKVRSQMTWQVVDGEPKAFDWDYPQGTVARQETAYPFTDNSDKARPAALAWLQRTNPPPPEPFRPPAKTVALMERGEHVYNNVCITCHGESAFGNGSITKLGFPAPPSLHTAEARRYSAARIFHIITLGQNVMPSYAWRVPPEDRWALAAYVHALQYAFQPNADSAPPAKDTAAENPAVKQADPAPDAGTAQSPDAGTASTPAAATDADAAPKEPSVKAVVVPDGGGS